MNRTQLVLRMLACGSLLVACARSGPPLPGDSVAQDGAVTLSPPRSSVAPQTREAMGPVEARLFAPELVMEHQAAIALQPAQKEAMLKVVDAAQAELLRSKFDLEAEREKLTTVLEASKVDEARATEAAAQVMRREDAIKSAHLAMLVRVKNLLTPEQQDRLRALRDQDRCGVVPASAEPRPSPSVHTPPDGAVPSAPRLPRPPAPPRPKHDVDPF